MGVLHPKPGPHPVHTIHRVSAAAIGLFLTVFGVLGAIRGLPMFALEGSAVLGLTSNGLLSVISMIVGVVLVAAGIRGGPTASTISIAVGVLFLISGVGNTFVLGSQMNMLAFSVPNVFFSIAVGTVLLLVGCYGRVSGQLPPDSPYSSAEVPEDPATDATAQAAERNRNGAAAAELADAERADALHSATAEQVRRLTRVRGHRSHDDRLRSWQASGDRPPRRGA